MNPTDLEFDALRIADAYDEVVRYRNELRTAQENLDKAIKRHDLIVHEAWVKQTVRLVKEKRYGNESHTQS